MIPVNLFNCYIKSNSKIETYIKVKFEDALCKKRDCKSKINKHTGLAGPEWLGRERRRGTCESESRRPESIAEDRRGAWLRTQLVSVLAFEPRPSCRGLSSPTSSPRATSSPTSIRFDHTKTQP